MEPDGKSLVPVTKERLELPEDEEKMKTAKEVAALIRSLPVKMFEDILEATELQRVRFNGVRRLIAHHLLVQGLLQQPGGQQTRQDWDDNFVLSAIFSAIKVGKITF